MGSKKNSKATLAPLLLLLFVLLFLTAFRTSFFRANEDLEKNTELNNSFPFNIPQETRKASQKKEKSIFYYFDEFDTESTVFSGLINYGKENNIEIKYNNNYSYGVFIESIDGIKNGTDGKYWQYYINGVLGDTASDKKVLKKGDKVEWKFEKVGGFKDKETKQSS